MDVVNMPVTKEKEPEHQVLDVSTQQRNILNVAPAVKPQENKAAEFYGNLSVKLKEVAQNIVGDAGAKLNFIAVVNNATAKAAGAMGDEGMKLAQDLNQSYLKQGQAVRETLDDQNKMRLALMIGSAPSELHFQESKDLLNQVNGSEGPLKEKLAKIEEWKNARVAGIRQVGDEERAGITAKIDEMKKPLVISHIADSIATRYKIEYPQSDKESVQPLIKDAVTKAWETAYAEVYGRKAPSG